MTSRAVHRWEDLGERADFTRLLDNHVNIRPEQVNTLERQVEWLQDGLWSQADVVGHAPRLVAQGSWAQRTIIAPRGGRDFDADLLVLVPSEPGWGDRPSQYLTALNATVLRVTGGRFGVRVRTRSVEVKFDDHHVDLVPYVVRPRGEWWPRGYIVNGQLEKFERVNPQGFTDWFQKRDVTANRELRIVTRLLKYVRDGRQGLEIPSVILTLLLAGQVKAGEAARGAYRDTPMAFHTLVSSLARWLAARPTVPRVPDPSCWGLGFEHRLPPEVYAGLRHWIMECANIAEDAVAAHDLVERVRHWRRLFGEVYAED